MPFEEVVEFWFQEIEPKDRWKKDPSFDAEISQRFGALHLSGGRGELSSWRCEPRGRLAEIIVLDQFSRNIHRDAPGAFALDGMALVLAQEAVALNIDREFSGEEKAFLYMPYMHSESPVIHETAVQLFSQPGLEDNLAFEIRHKEIVERFGRYPHRNEILGRVSTPEEVVFLKQPGSRF